MRCQWRHKIIVEVDIDAIIWADFNTKSEPNSATWITIRTSAFCGLRIIPSKNVTKLIAYIFAVGPK